jgi:predicted transport protein
MPQNEDLSQAWRTELGSEWKRVHETWLHTLGNLTLTGYNSEYSYRPFEEKRDMPGGFKESPLKLNNGIGQLDKWDEEAIKERAGRLASIALDVWAAPKIKNDVLEVYKSKNIKSRYTIKNHPEIHTGPLHVLFKALRQELLGLDPCVTEEFLSNYVAYKAETNFVYVVSETKRLLLSLNMPLSEIYDPKEICGSILTFKLSGNYLSDARVYVESLDELPYVMGLVRQSFERQMGNGGEK